MTTVASREATQRYRATPQGETVFKAAKARYAHKTLAERLEARRIRTDARRAGK